MGVNITRIRSKLGPTQSLCQYIACSSYDDLPDSVRLKAKMCILDSLGCLLGGSTLEPARIVLGLLTELQGKPESTLIPTGLKVPTIHAAYGNSYLANLMDFDDVGWGHPGACIIPPALAVAERKGSSGRELINAVVQAYEVHARIADAIYPLSARQAKVRGRSTYQIFAAVTAASILLHHDDETTATAFGLAGVNAPVPSSPTSRSERPLTWSKFNFGWASMGGVLAALLAERGFIGNRTILDGEKGFWIMAGSDHCNFKEFTRGLGEEYKILDLRFKPYPCCGYLHSSVEAVKQIVTEHNISLASIERIHIQSFSHIEKCMDYAPRNAIDAEFSLPYAIAMVLVGKPPGYEWFSEVNLRNPEVLKMAQRVTFELDPEADKLFYRNHQYRSTISLFAGGTEFKASIGHPKSLSPAELKEKFRELSFPLLGISQTEEVIKWVEQLQDFDNVSSLLTLLRPKA